ncbi:uncharacterized protein LOC131654164 [Vicia villosa]|uniref:uncharacterized protein LOC131632463 n=1 Tax=Vicia villosa TaxID=3911 RepID=UPI00273BF69D|nr:uncharacterized protein LOC131632463 [Vicia villosa]XP_058780569.1 uncharacterized protein LOC131654162 [Vicia villosa]XP_058780571.1 uncharacterized protein LOC131654164 [Vicia villosa]
MENNLPVISKRVLSLVRVAFFMLKKEISKGKIMMNLNMILRRRSKLAGKAIANLISHHPNHGGSTSNRHSHYSHQFTSSREYEFSCSNTPNHFFSIGKRHHIHNHKNNAQARLMHDDEVTTMNAMKAVVEMLNNDQTIVEASPGFPLRDDDEKDNQVDKAAEDFIKRFYSQLRKQD